MLWLTASAVVGCEHGGKVDIQATQSLVRIGGTRVLVQPNPDSRGITGCSAGTVVTPPCTHTIKILSGYSRLLRIQGHPVCVSALTGLTDGVAPGSQKFRVFTPGQTLVSEVS